MGRTYLFECAKCGYRVTVAGGAAEGAHLVVQTIHCLDCRELFDAVTELKVLATITNLSRWKLKPTPFETGPSDENPPKFEAALKQLMAGSGKRFRWVKFKTVCPVSARHRIRVWKQPGKCPRCGVFLEGGGTTFKAWD